MGSTGDTRHLFRLAVTLYAQGEGERENQ
jgi:hypothetical protein